MSTTAGAAAAAANLATKPPSWFAHLPAPKAVPAGMSVDGLRTALQALEEGSKQPQVLVVDVRRADIEPPMDYLIKGAVNLPAQTFHATLPALLPMLSRYPKVVFHCSSSNGRGPRCAGWYQDALDEARLTTSEAVILTGGIKAWVDKFGEGEDAVVRL